MGLIRSRPLAFRARSLCDTLDSTTSFSGAMAQLTNLIPDPTTDGQWVCRPAATQIAGHIDDPWSSGWSSGFGPILGSVGSGNLSAILVLGTRIFGMMSTHVFPGFDTPFCFDTVTGQGVLITGITANNIPSSLVSTGAWIPPTMTLVGTKIIVCHQGFSGSNYIGSISVANPAALTWTAGNLSGAITLTTPPTACGQFNGRAYYLINPLSGQPSAVFSDALVPLNCTNANQVLTFGDNLSLTFAIGLPLSATSIGGIIQALMVFKGATNIYQITGDSTTSNLSVNALNVSTGTLAVNSIATTPKGIVFAAPDGLRVIDFNAHVSDPIGLNGQGVNLPFLAVLQPSRMAAAYNNNVYRVTLQNGAALSSPNQEFWYDFARQRWSGPHTSTFAFVAALGSSFVGQLIGNYSTLVKSDTVQSGTSTFVESGAQLAFTWQTSMLPDTDRMCENAMVETTLFMAFNAGDIYNAVAVDQMGSVFDAIQLASPTSPSLWGSLIWGQGLWGGAATAIAPQWLTWHHPLVFRRLSIGVTGNCSAAVKIGAMHLKYQELGYLQQTLSGH